MKFFFKKNLKKFFKKSKVFDEISFLKKNKENSKKKKNFTKILRFLF